jgi:glutamine synthetase
MPGNLTLEALGQAVAAGEIDTVVLAQTDMQGRLMGKRCHARHFVDHAVAGAHACNYLLTVDMEMTPVPGYASANWQEGYGDYMMVPDLATLRRLPWLDGTALVLCDVRDHHGGADIAVAPRAILKRQVARLADLGFAARFASELEFFAFEESFEQAAARGWRGLTPVSRYNEDYHIFQTTKEEGLLRAVRNGLYGAGVPVEGSKGEACAGQAEVNIRHGDPLTMADDHVLAKNAIKEIAWQQGRAVTFLAKWDNAAAGSSCHIHQSLRLADDSPAFHDADAPYGMSATMRHFLAGQIAHTDAIACFLAPHINSYKRFRAGTFAPARAVWSRDNRTVGYRICGVDSPAIRVECRIGGADLNPYLAFAALIAAGIDGIERRLEPPEEFRGNAYDTQAGRAVPASLREAAMALDRSGMLRSALGDNVVDHYLNAARWELAEHDRRVTDWEIARGFERA